VLDVRDDRGVADHHGCSYVKPLPVAGLQR
jgi:hypothetical protein